MLPPPLGLHVALPIVNILSLLAEITPQFFAVAIFKFAITNVATLASFALESGTKRALSLLLLLGK